MVTLFCDHDARLGHRTRNVGHTVTYLVTRSRSKRLFVERNKDHGQSVAAETGKDRDLELRR
ncbi:MAG: hypothetical protein ACYDEY_10035, partial [Acidimicrobiales bacterium]